MNSPLLRLLDANANRAREGLRVVEDYARFVLDDEALCRELKQMRHDLVGATSKLLLEAILQRNTPADVGTTIATDAEGRRVGISDVVSAAGKRLGEALRSIEESLKVLAPEDAGRVEALRYRFYEVERRVALTLRPGSARFADVGLYVLVTESVCRRPWLEAAEDEPALGDRGVGRCGQFAEGARPEEGEEEEAGQRGAERLEPAPTDDVLRGEGDDQGRRAGDEAGREHGVEARVLEPAVVARLCGSPRLSHRPHLRA